MKLIKMIIVIIFMLISFVVGAVISYEHTMVNIKASSENGGVILLEVYGQEWIYEE